MRRGTTPTLTFTTPYAGDLIADGYITFNQRGKTVVEKRLTDAGVTITDYKISVEFTQEETLAFNALPSAPAEAQIRVIMTDGTRTASNVVDIPICRILKDGEI